MKKITSTHLYLALYGVLVFFTPLLFVTNTKEAFEFPKMHFVYALGTIIIATFLVHRIARWNFKFVRPNLWALAILGVVFVSTLLSAHTYTSIFGYYSRFNGGLFSYLIFFGLYFVAINVFNRKFLERVVFAAVFALLPISIFALHQAFNKPDIFRVYSTFGQPNWLAAFIAMLLPFVLYKIFTTLDTASESVGQAKQTLKPLHLKIILSVICILGYTSLWFTYSMSGILGFTAGVIALIVFDVKMFRRNIKTVAALFSIMALISILNLGTYQDRFEDVFLDLRKVSAQTEEAAQPQNTQYSDNTNNAVNPEFTEGNNLSDPGFIRINMWKGAIDMATSSPKIVVIGSGPETFPYIFQQFRPPELNYSSEWDFILNKPHNFYLEIWSETGLLGLISYGGLIVYTIRKRSLKYTPGLIALYVTNIFGWPTVAASLMFWIFVAGIDIEQRALLKSSKAS